MYHTKIKNYKNTKIGLGMGNLQDIESIVCRTQCKRYQIGGWLSKKKNIIFASEEDDYEHWIGGSHGCSRSLGCMLEVFHDQVCRRDDGNFGLCFSENVDWEAFFFVSFCLSSLHHSFLSRTFQSQLKLLFFSLLPSPQGLYFFFFSFSLMST